MNYLTRTFTTKGLTNSLCISDLSLKVLYHWNNTIPQRHKIRNSKILKRFDSLIQKGINTEPEYFNLYDLNRGIDIYQKHLFLPYSKIFKKNMNIDEFFLFSDFYLKKIEADKKWNEAFKGIKSVFYQILTDEDFFYYKGSKADPEFEMMISAIAKMASESFAEKDKIRIAGIKIQNCYLENIKDLVLCEGIVTEYEIQNKETFQNKENFFNWFVKFLINKHGLSQGKFNINYLCSNFLYNDFIKFMRGISR